MKQIFISWKSKQAPRVFFVHSRHLAGMQTQFASRALNLNYCASLVPLTWKFLANGWEDCHILSTFFPLQKLGLESWEKRWRASLHSSPMVLSLSTFLSLSTPFPLRLKLWHPISSSSSPTSISSPSNPILFFLHLCSILILVPPPVRQGLGWALSQGLKSTSVTWDRKGLLSLHCQYKSFHEFSESSFHILFLWNLFWCACPSLFTYFPESNYPLLYTHLCSQWPNFSQLKSISFDGCLMRHSSPLPKESSSQSPRKGGPVEGPGECPDWRYFYPSQVLDFYLSN